MTTVVHKKSRTKKKTFPSDRKKNEEVKKGPPAERAPMENGNPILAAELYFGSRLVTRPTGEQFLDGTPCDLNRKMKQYNLARQERNLPPVGRNPNWLP